jgi:ketosteroid isomerase-like protein
MTVSMDPVGDRWEIRSLIERYASAADRRDGAAAAAVFSEDGELEIWLTPGDATSSIRRGHAEVAAAIDRIAAYDATQHVIASSVIDVTGDEARADTRCNAHHVTRRAAPPGPGEAVGSDLVLYLRYLDSCARGEAGWRITRRELRVQWTATYPVESM